MPREFCILQGQGWTEEAREIANLKKRLTNQHPGNRGEEIGKRDQQHNEVIRQRDEAIRQRENTLRKREKYEEELRNALHEANLQIMRLEDETSATKVRQGSSETADEVSGLRESLKRREQEVASLQATIEDKKEAIRKRDQELADAIASAKKREEGLRRKLKDLLDEKYARDLEDLERQKKEMARQMQEMERVKQDMERQKQGDIESFGPR